MHSIQKKAYLIYIFWLLIFIFFTNNHFNYEQIVLTNQLDSVSYMSIAIFSPDYSSENLPYHHAQRFFIPYLIGFVANTLNISPIIIFRLFSYLIVLSIVFLHFLITKKLKTDFFLSIFSISFLILNPYLIRYFIAVPTMINDAVFILALYLFSIGLIFNYKLGLIGVIFALVSRQNGIFIFVAYIVNNLINKRLNIFKNTSVISSIIFLIIISLLSNNYANKVSVANFDFRHVYGFFEWIDTSFNLIELLKWILLPFYSYLPLLIISFFYFEFKNLDKINKKNFFILVFILISIIGIPFLSGPDLASRNIIRLTSLAYPIILIIGLCFVSIKDKLLNNIFFIFIIIILHIWSLHPKYSTISIFEFFRNYLI